MAARQDNFNNPLILAIETSGRLGSVAIAQGEKLLGDKHFTGPMRHSAEVFPAILGLLEQFDRKPADIKQVYLSIGPGSFTGLRIAVTIAKTMALANGAKIVAVDTLDCIAANVINFTQPEIERLAVILDAKRGQFFVAVYEKTQDPRPKTQDPIWEKTLPDCLMTADEFSGRLTDKPIALIGEGLVYYKDQFNNTAVRVLDEKYWNPSAANVHKLGWELARQGRFADPIALTPNYIRGPDVKIKQI
ncbi:MAG: tRNA (adenosine(37)-N6)-threonylcarbamoyltransferase complex dimerization subunit type 1 TsaB [Sedimentisphaerales bacterium]|jgi:tRNA threonylcarbamoyladenosine biosynthesis protein TsaB